MKIYLIAHVQQTKQDFSRQFFQSILRHAARDDGIVMRPDRAIVIGERIVPGFATSQSADSPSGAKLAAEK